MNCQATRPEREPRVIDHSLASARSSSSGRSEPVMRGVGRAPIARYES